MTFGNRRWRFLAFEVRVHKCGGIYHLLHELQVFVVEELQIRKYAENRLTVAPVSADLYSTDEYGYDNWDTEGGMESISNQMTDQSYTLLNTLLHRKLYEAHQSQATSRASKP